MSVVSAFVSAEELRVGTYELSFSTSQHKSAADVLSFHSSVFLACYLKTVIHCDYIMSVMGERMKEYGAFVE
jgi:5-hydroxyisourate hydrolase-like protein (transthyretin family)